MSIQVSTKAPLLIYLRAFAIEILITKENYFSFFFIVRFLCIIVILFCVLIQFYFLRNFDLFIELFLSAFKLFVSKFLRFYIVSILVRVFLNLIFYSYSKSNIQHMIREMFDRGNVRSGKCLRGKCPVGEVSVGEVSGRGIFCSGKCPSGMCPLGKCQSESVHGEVSVGPHTFCFRVKKMIKK